MKGMHRLMAMVIYGGGLRLSECVRLRIKDLDMERGGYNCKCLNPVGLLIISI